MRHIQANELENVMANAEALTLIATADREEQQIETWAANATLLWRRRVWLARVTVIGFVLSILLMLVMPKQYKSTTRIMSPDQSSSSGLAMMAALAGHAGGASGLSSIAGSLLSSHSSSAVFVDLLTSPTIAGRLMSRFDLQHVYKKRYKTDTIKYITRHTKVTDDKKSGIITVTYEDTDPQRAAAITRAYIEELNVLVTSTNNSSARREREFIEKRLVSVNRDLETAQQELSAFSSKNSAIDIKEQTRAMVDAGARLEAELIAGHAELDSIQQVYGDGNVRVKAARARLGVLQAQLKKMSGAGAAPLGGNPDDAGQQDQQLSNEAGNLYPPLRSMPGLAVPYADLYRRVRVQEAVFELLSQEHEMARLQEAKDTPVASVIDVAGVPEKKSWPPRVLLTLCFTALTFGGACFYSLARDRWNHTSPLDGRKRFASEVMNDVRALGLPRLARRDKGVV